MTLAPEHAPKMARLSLSERLQPWMPVLLVPALILAGYLSIASPSSWLTLTVSGLAMGMMIFVIASGMTLVFGLMDVINFGHGAFVSFGAFVGVSVLLVMTGMTGAPSLMLNLLAVGAAMLGAMAVTGVLGLGFERVIVRPVYGSHLKQILVTMGGLIVAEQLIHVIWGGEEIFIGRPEMLKGSITLFGMFVFVVILMIGGMAVDVMRYENRRVHLQNLRQFRAKCEGIVADRQAAAANCAQFGQYGLHIGRICVIDLSFWQRTGQIIHQLQPRGDNSHFRSLVNGNLVRPQCRQRQNGRRRYPSARA